MSFPNFNPYGGFHHPNAGNFRYPGAASSPYEQYAGSFPHEQNGGFGSPYQQYDNAPYNQYAAPSPYDHHAVGAGYNQHAAGHAYDPYAPEFDPSSPPPGAQQPQEPELTDNEKLWREHDPRQPTDEEQDWIEEQINKAEQEKKNAQVQQAQQPTKPAPVKPQASTKAEPANDEEPIKKDEPVHPKDTVMQGPDVILPLLRTLPASFLLKNGTQRLTHEWFMEQIGLAHFTNKKGTIRKMLRKDSWIRTEYKQHGFTLTFVRWLTGEIPVTVLRFPSEGYVIKSVVWEGFEFVIE